MARQLADVRAVLFDRDGTLVHDQPEHLGDPHRVRCIPEAARAVARLREEGLPVGVISNQAGIGRGHVTAAQVERVNARVDELLGPFDTWRYCPHTPADGCRCRKPAPGLVHRAAEDLGVPAHTVAVIGDIGTDVQAAQAAGAVGILVPSLGTLQAEVRESPLVAWSLVEAVTLILARRRIGNVLR
jgi:histidinol-phosphate phosphatase family protein